MHYTSKGYDVKYDCGETAMWHLSRDSGEELYFCIRCHDKYCDDQTK